jgi:inner membrane protein
VIGIFIWILGANPGVTFLIMYGVVIAYYVRRYLAKLKVLQEVKSLIPDATEVIIAPTMRFHQWRIAAMNKKEFFVGKSVNHQVEILDRFIRIPVPNTPVIEAAKKDKNLSAFLSFSPVYRWEVDEYSDFYEVRFIDLRYRSNGHYPFVAVVQLDLDLQPISSYTGWVFSEKKLRKKLSIIPS